MDRFLIIADDFTGANDTGVQFRKRGIPTEVVFDSRDICGTSSFVIDTESRNLEGEEAYQTVKRIAVDTRKNPFDLVYKKVDSTLRGNVAIEIKAINEVYRPELILFAPAYPDNNRTTVNAVQQVAGIPLTRTEFAGDPQKPVQEDNLRKLLESMGEPIEHIRREILYSLDSGLPQGRIFTFDVSCNDDLRKIADVGLRTGKNTLWIGSAGLADAILDVECPMDPVLVVAGSVSSVTQSQVEWAVSAGLEKIKVDIASLLRGDENAEGIIRQAIASLRKRRDTLLASAYTPEDYRAALDEGQRRGMSKEEVSRFAQQMLGQITKGVLHRTRVSGLFLTGGDTAISVIRHLKAVGSIIQGEILPGIPLMSLKSGLLDGLKVVTKAGAFGGTDAISHCVKKIKER